MVDTASGDAIEYLTLGSALKRNKGMPVTAAQMKAFDRGSGEVRIFAGGATYVDTDRANVPPKGLLSGPSIIVKSRGNIGFEFWTGLFSHKNELWSYSPKHPGVNIKYVYYYLESLTKQLHELAKSKSVKMPQLAVSDIDALVVPFPELSIQGEVVRTLDAFAALERELEAELHARTKQFEHSARQMLALESAPRRPLGELVEIRDSERIPISRDQRESGDVPYYGANGIQDYVSNYLFDGDFLLVGEDGSVINKDGSPVLNWATGKIWVNNHAHVLAGKASGPSLRFLYHALARTDVKKIVRGTPPKINQENLKAIEVPEPSVQFQEEIVRRLDAFEALISEIEVELGLRRKQYEHYRNQLLNFKGDKP